jgi:SOS response regulatory protein OraA/RecX
VPAPPRTSFQQKRAAREAARERRASVDDPNVVMEAAATFLAVRPRSVAETGRRLRYLGYPRPIIDAVLERLAELGYLDDEAFARLWVESRDRASPRGQAALRRELGLKGVPRDVIDAVLLQRAEGNESHVVGASGAPGEQGPGPDRLAAERLLARRRAALDRESDPRKRRQKAYSLLARNGFDPETCREVSALVVGERDVAEDGA